MPASARRPADTGSPRAARAEGGADLWHSRLRHRVHLIEVAEDFSDLHELVQWALSHPTQAEKIARAGQEVALANMELRVSVDELAKMLPAVAVKVDEYDDL